MTRNVRQFFLVALHELRDAFSSRWAVALLVLFILIFTAASLGFVKYLHKVEQELLELMSLDASDAPGSTTQTLWKSKRFQRMVGNLVGDKELAEEVLSHPPFSIFTAPSR